MQRTPLKIKWTINSAVLVSILNVCEVSPWKSAHKTLFERFLKTTLKWSKTVRLVLPGLAVKFRSQSSKLKKDGQKWCNILAKSVLNSTYHSSNLFYTKAGLKRPKNKGNTNTTQLVYSSSDWQNKRKRERSKPQRWAFEEADRRHCPQFSSYSVSNFHHFLASYTMISRLIVWYSAKQFFKSRLV